MLISPEHTDKAKATSSNRGWVARGDVRVMKFMTPAEVKQIAKRVHTAVLRQWMNLLRVDNDEGINNDEGMESPPEGQFTTAPVSA